MRRVLVSASVLLAALAVLRPPMAAQGPAAADAVERVGGREARTREALVKFRRAPRPAELLDVDADAVASVGRAGVYRVRSRSLGAAALVARLARRADVEYAEPNYIVSIAAAPNDPSFPSLWGLENLGQPVGGIAGTPGADIGAADAWDLSVGSPHTVVAVIDTGVDYTHEDLAANMWTAPGAFTVNLGGFTVTCAAGTHGYNAILRTCDPMDDHNHGTHVAGTIGAEGNNQRGVVGVNWTTRLMAIKFLNAQGTGTVADAISGLRFALEAKRAFAASAGADVRVLSNSWGGAGFSQALLDEINAARQADMLFVAAAGNSSRDNDVFPSYPASYAAENVVAVAATNNLDQRAWFSNYGDQTVHLGAPGESILSTTIGNAYQSFSGTSMATPHVSGAAALLLSVCSVGTAALKDALIGTVDAVPALAGRTITGGRLNLHSAVHSCVAAPSAPTGLAADGADNRVALSWTTSLGATRYLVKRSTTSGGPYAAIAADVKGGTYTDATAVNGTTYYYVVAAANPLGESEDSNEASATPKAPPDLAVTSVQPPPPAGPGATFSVAVTTQNKGVGPADATVTAMYLSANSLIDPADRRLVGVPIAPLSPGASVTTTVAVPIPADVAVGFYYLLGVADADGDEAESFESNNEFVRTLRVGPDLEIVALTVPQTGAPGAALSINTTVENGGGAPAGAFTVAFYLSSNSTIDAGDVLLEGQRTLASLAAGASSAGASTVTIPPGTAVGTYQLIAKADGQDAIAESHETNNTTSRTIRIGGDLVVSALTAPATAGAGAAIAVTASTNNQGTAPVAASITRFFLSTDWQLGAGDVQLDGSHAVPELGPAATSTATVAVTIPVGTQTGAYYLLAVADAAGAVPETQESNNVASRGMQVGTDLVIAALSVPAKGAAGQPLAISETTRNQGSGSAGASSTRFFLSQNPLLDAGDTLLAPDHAVPELGPGASHAASLSVVLPSTLAAGTYYVFARADAGDLVPETSESNNTLSRTVQVGGDLVITAFTAPPRGGAGGSIAVSDTTANQGGGPVGGSGTRFYLSVNSLFDAGDTLLAGTHAVPPLEAGASHAATTTVEIPAGTAAGPYYLIARADGDAGVLEIQETNNTYTRGFQVGPDLTVADITGPSKGAAGAPIVVTDVTTNQGGGDAAGSAVSFYLSADWILDAADVDLGVSRPLPALASGATSTVQTTLMIPPQTASGVYYVIAKVDAAGAVPETQEGNNTDSYSLRIGPDLRLSPFWASPAKTAPGGTVNANDTVVNQGGGPAGASMVRFYLSSNYTLDPADVPLGERAVPALAAGESASAVTPITIPAGTAPGSYHVLAFADADGAVDESPETNNVTAAPFQVTIVP